MQARRSPRGIRRFTQGLLGLPLSAGLTLTAPDRALAIPEADAIKKLEVIPVFVLADDKGVPWPIRREKSLLLPLYLERAKADQELANLVKASPGAKAQVLAIPLNVMNERVAALNKQLKDKTKPLVAPVVVNPGDRQQAVAMLKQQGLNDKQIEEKLSVPVFFTRPFLTINTPKGPRGVFFLSYTELQQALAKVADRNKLEPQVADLTAVLREIIKAPEDRYLIFPTQDYFRLVRDNQGKTPNTDLAWSPKDINMTKAGDQGISTKTKDNHLETVSELAKSITVRIEGPGPSGSGTIFKKTNRTHEVLTAWHVVSSGRPGEEAYIVLSNGKRYPVDRGSVRQIRKSDLAILSFTPSDDLDIPRPHLSLHPKPSTKLWISGWSLPTSDNPLLYRLLDGSLVSATASQDQEGYALSYTTTSPTLPGMSGGPILDESGMLVGIHGRAERLSIKSHEGVKEVATMTSLGIPITALRDAP